ncbi:hypothetical protein [Pseudonocardia acaciae]|uniref:hypothetical protein n=1 Tax=Pseudonocardia acaciae TaxID=551276 RepID=UPI0012EE900D|nr:hypothetical protein [Pseudonocardia acaciae]
MKRQALLVGVPAVAITVLCIPQASARENSTPGPDGITVSEIENCSYGVQGIPMGGTSSGGGTPVLGIKFNGYMTGSDAQQDCNAYAQVAVAWGDNKERVMPARINGPFDRDNYVTAVSSPDGSGIHVLGRKIRTCKGDRCADWSTWHK